MALLALALLATPAAAKTWYNQDCSLVVTSGGKGFKYESLEIGGSTLCTVKSWPIDSPVATMQCDDGSTPLMEIVDEGIIRFAGVVFAEPHEPESCGFVDEVVSYGLLSGRLMGEPQTLFGAE